MTSHVARLYAVAIAIVVFFVGWVAIAAHPWVTPRQDPAVVALALREQRLHAQSIAVKHVLDRRWAAYQTALQARQKAVTARQASNRAVLATAPAAPSVRVVTLPPLTVTRTS
jgi:hypothetical protein